MEVSFNNFVKELFSNDALVSKIVRCSFKLQHTLSFFLRKMTVLKLNFQLTWWQRHSKLAAWRQILMVRMNSSRRLEHYSKTHYSLFFLQCYALSDVCKNCCYLKEQTNLPSEPRVQYFDDLTVIAADFCKCNRVWFSNFSSNLMTLIRSFMVQIIHNIVVGRWVK